MENNSNNGGMNMGAISREKLDQVATWFSATVSSAFFSSLERFSCVNVSTTDPDDDDPNYPEEAKDRPLTLTTHSHSQNDVADLPV